MNRFVLAFLLSFSINTQAEAPSFSGDSLHKLYVEMLYLYQTGLTIHQQYDTSDKTQLKACSGEYGYVSTRAKSVIGIANRLEHSDKAEFINAGWATLACVKCTTDISVCDSIPTTLKKMRQELQAQNNR